MKKLTTLLLAAGLVVSSFAGASSASAVEVKPFGQFVTEFVGYSGHPTGAEGNGLAYDYNLDAAYRFRLGLDMVASENVSATVLLQFGAYNFGDNGPGVTGPADVKFRWLYLDWVVPNTDVQVRMGRHVFTLPSYAFDSSIMNDFADGVTVAADINENLAVSAMWIRSDVDVSVNNNADDPTLPAAYSNSRGEINDAFAVAASYQGEGYAIAPFAVYQMAGKNSAFNATSAFGFNPNQDADAWYLGAAFELSMFDPFTFALDAHYKHVSTDKDIAGVGGNSDSEGFYYVAAKAAYATDYGVPAVRGWYASGVDLDSSEAGFAGAGAGIEADYCATSILFGDNYIGNQTNILNSDPQGKMGIMFEWADISFIENVTHVARVLYTQGTNDADPNKKIADWNRMTDDDSAVEVNFNTKYQMYEDFSVLLDLGWIAPDFENSNDDGLNEDIYRAALMFIYSF